MTKDIFRKLPAVCLLRILKFYNEMRFLLKREQENELFVILHGPGLLRAQHSLLRAEQSLSRTQEELLARLKLFSTLLSTSDGKEPIQIQ